MRTDTTTFPEPPSYQAWGHQLDGIHTSYEARGKHLVPAAWEKKKIRPGSEIALSGGSLSSEPVKTKKRQIVANLISGIKSRWGRRESGAEKIWALGVFGGASWELGKSIWGKR